MNNLQSVVFYTVYALFIACAFGALFVLHAVLTRRSLRCMFGRHARLVGRFKLLAYDSGAGQTPRMLRYDNWMACSRCGKRMSDVWECVDKWENVDGPGKREQNSQTV